MHPFVRVKTAVNQTHSRSFKTKAGTIRPPPLPAINGVAGSGSLLPREPWKSIRQGGQGIDPVDQFPDEWRFAHVAGGELCRAEFQRLLVNSDVDLAPRALSAIEPRTMARAPFRATVLARSSGKQSPGLFSDPPHHCSQAGGRVYRSAQPPRSWRDQTRSSASRGASALRYRRASSWSCRRGV